MKINIGKCSHCKKDVKAEEGSSVAWRTEILTKHTGEEISRTSYPVHPRCKILVDNELDR